MHACERKAFGDRLTFLLAKTCIVLLITGSCPSLLRSSERRAPRWRHDLVLTQERPEAVDVVQQAVDAVGMPEGSGIDRNHWLVQPPFGISCETNH